MQKTIIVIGAISAALGVILGAFGAHALEATLVQNNRLDTFETAVRYQMYHSLAIILIGLMMNHLSSRLLVYSSYSMVAGIILFSGSLYILSLSGITKLGMITPVGGLGFIAGWILFITAIIKN